jgi:hypothetical protein
MRIITSFVSLHLIDTVSRVIAITLTILNTDIYKVHFCIVLYVIMITSYMQAVMT